MAERTTRQRPLGAAVLATSLALAGCAASGGSPGETDTGARASTPAPQREGPLPRANPEQAMPFPAHREADSARSSKRARLSPTGMRFGVHHGFDRLVVDLSGEGEPGWRATYVRHARAAGSGKRIDLRGNAVLRLRIKGVVPPTAADAEAWHGPEDLTPSSGGIIEEARRGVLHEGRQDVFLGLDSAEPFRVFALDHPTRVVVDVRDPAAPTGDRPLPGIPHRSDAPFPANRRPDTGTTVRGARLHPRDLRFGRHHTFDRLVLELHGHGLPGWHAAYAEDPRLPGSGAPLRSAGGHTLVVRVRGVVPPDHPRAEGYHGPQRFVPRGGGVAEVVYGTVFEGSTQVYVGLSRRAPFRVFRLRHPKRVVIDVEHAGGG